MSYEQAMRWTKKHPRGTRQPVLSGDCEANLARKIAPMKAALADVRQVFRSYVNIFEPMGCDCSAQQYTIILMEKVNCPLSASQAGRAALEALEDMWPPCNWLTGFKHKNAIMAALEKA